MKNKKNYRRESLTMIKAEYFDKLIKGLYERKESLRSQERALKMKVSLSGINDKVTGKLLERVGYIKGQLEGVHNHIESLEMLKDMLNG